MVSRQRGRRKTAQETANGRLKQAYRGGQRNNRMKKSVAYGLVMVVSVFWGMSFIVLTQLLKWLGTMEILALRWTLASVIFACLIGAGRIRINLRGKNMKFLLLTGLTEPCIYSVFEIYGLKYSSASISSIFIATIPCATLLVSILFFHKKPGRKYSSGVCRSCGDYCVFTRVYRRRSDAGLSVHDRRGDGRNCIWLLQL